MGFELDAFVGAAAELETWSAALPAAVACRLAGDLSLVPVTGTLFRQLIDRLGDEARQLDAARPSAYPPPSYREAVRRWGREVSTRSPVAFLSTGEFGNQSHEEATVWLGGCELAAGASVRTMLDRLRSAGLNPGHEEIDFGRYRGENAAERWAAAARKGSP